MRIVDLRSESPPEDWGVAVDLAAAYRLAESWAGEPFGPPRWDFQGLPASLHGPGWLDFCGLAVSVLACLWPAAGEEPWQVEHEGKWLHDAPALFWCFTRSQDDWQAPDLGLFRDWTDHQAGLFFRGRGHLQLVERRRRRLAAVSEAVAERWNGRFVHLVEDAGFDGPRTVELLAATIPGYRDEVASLFGLLKFNKLAHLATAMMASREGFEFSGLDDFPVYPDYMLPRLLRHHGLLRYDAELAAAVDGRRPLTPEGSWELAIRWGTVHAAEKLRAALARRGKAVSGPALDFHLWHAAVLGPEADSLGEHHRTLTLAY